MEYIVDLQYCVSFRCTAKWSSYTYTYIHSFSDSLPIEIIIKYWVELLNRKILAQEMWFNFKEHEVFVQKRNQENTHSVDMRDENYDDSAEGN